MYLVAWADKPTAVDHFQLFEGEPEARARIALLMEDEHVSCWALTRVLDASEPHWMDGGVS
jgi:hypothetical protein